MKIKAESQTIFSICENTAYAFFTDDEDIAVSADVYFYDYRAAGPEFAFGFSVDLSLDETGALRDSISASVVMAPKEHSAAFTKLTVDTDRLYSVDFKVEFKKLVEPGRVIEALEKAMKQQYVASADWLCLTNAEWKNNENITKTLLNWDY